MRDNLRSICFEGALMAVSDKIRGVLGWSPRHDDLDFIVRTLLEWEQRLMALGMRSHNA